MKIFVYSASLREDSVNLRLSRLIAKVAEANGAEVDFARINDFDMPMYNFDDQQSSGVPAGAKAPRWRVSGHVASEEPVSSPQLSPVTAAAYGGLAGAIPRARRAAVR